MPISHHQTEAQILYVKFEMFRYCSGRGLAGVLRSGVAFLPIATCAAHPSGGQNRPSSHMIVLPC